MNQVAISLNNHHAYNYPIPVFAPRNTPIPVLCLSLIVIRGGVAVTGVTKGEPRRYPARGGRHRGSLVCLSGPAMLPVRCLSAAKLILFSESFCDASWWTWTLGSSITSQETSAFRIIEVKINVPLTFCKCLSLRLNGRIQCISMSGRGRTHDSKIHYSTKNYLPKHICWDVITKRR